MVSDLDSCFLGIVFSTWQWRVSRWLSLARSTRGETELDELLAAHFSKLRTVCKPSDSQRWGSRCLLRMFSSSGVLKGGLHLLSMYASGYLAGLQIGGPVSLLIATSNWPHIQLNTPYSIEH